MNHKKKLCLNKKIFLLFFINTWFLTYGLSVTSVLEKTDNNIGHKIQTLLGPFVLYYGFHQLWEKWKLMIEDTGVGNNTKNILTLGMRKEKHLFNYAIPLAAMFLTPRVNIRDRLHLYSNLFNTLITTLNTTKSVTIE